MIALAAAALSLTVSLQPSLKPVDLPQAPPPTVANPAPPELEAASWVLYSVEHDAEIVAVNPDQRRAMASVTKVMTAMIVIDNAEPGDPVTISEEAASTPIGYAEQPRVRQGDRWTVEELLANLLVQSGNDAAVALAEHVAGSVEAFVVLMNQMAADLGMAGTSFANPNGLDSFGHYSNARDLIEMGRAAIERDRLLRVTRIKAITFDPGTREEIPIHNTNRLLGVFPGVAGLKTGDTANAGRVLLSYVDSGPRRMLGVVMGARDHYGATADLIAYGLTAFGRSDYLLAPASGTPLDALVPDWMQLRLAAAGSLEAGASGPASRQPTPGERQRLGVIRDLLPPLLGGDE